MKVKKKVRFNLDHSSDDVSFFISIFLLKKFIRKKTIENNRYIPITKYVEANLVQKYFKNYLFLGDKTKE